MFLRSTKPASENGQSSKMDEVDAPQQPAARRRPLGDISNLAPAGRLPDAKRQAGHLPPPLPEPSVCDSVQTMGSALSVCSSMDDPRVYMRREADNIDSRDVDNPLLCTEVVNEMYDSFRRIEIEDGVDCAYMTNQAHVNEKMRTILIDWLIEVHLKFKMVPETLYLCVNVIDRYLQRKQVRRSKLQLLGVSALLASAKYEEIYPPEIRDLVYITDRAYNKHEILEMESAVVNALQFNFTVPTVHSFLCRYLKAAHADRTMVQLSCYLAERTLQEYCMLKYPPSIVAATAVLVARKSLNRHPWSPTLVKYTKYDECDLVDCLADMQAYMTEAETTAPGAAAQQAAQKKYSSPKFGSVSKTPLVFN
jgi:hypothetical protein